MPDKIVYLNGEYLPVEKAAVSVLDRGFLFGDGVYEVIPVYGGKLLRVDEHLQRLQNSLLRIGMGQPHNMDEWKIIFHALLEKNPGEDRALYLQVTRGATPIRDLTASAEIRPTVFAMVNTIKPVDVSELAKGIEAITVDDFRWHACDIKSISLVANVMLREQATQANVADAIMVREGVVSEGTASNVFIVKNSIIKTPPKSSYLLPGITRDLVIELAQQNAMPCEICEITQDELATADEIWLTSSTREIAPVIKLDGAVVGGGQAGDFWRKMATIYQEYKQRLRQD